MKKNPRIYGFNGQGFTLIELMVVMLLITIVLAVVIPRFDAAPFQDPGKKFSRWMINAVRHLRATAIEKQQPQALVVDLSNQRMWMIQDGMSEEEQAAAAEKAFALDGSIRIVNAQFRNQESVATGTLEIRFYPAGYSDQVLLHIENQDAERTSYLIEPLLPKLKIVDGWIEL
jgi:prepilin-type N-terminal cleavage/methylation domain-containing protein